MKLNETQEYIFSYLRVKKEEVSLDDISAYLKRQGKPLTRQGVIGSLASMNSILPKGGWLIQKTTGIGRGVKAKYKLERLHHDDVRAK